MKPIRTVNTNAIYRGNRPDVDDLPCERGEVFGSSLDGGRVVCSVWEPTEEERRQIARGSNVKLAIFGLEPIPPVSLQVVDETKLILREGTSKE